MTFGLLAGFSFATNSNAIEDVGLANCGVKAPYIWWKSNEGNSEYLIETWAREPKVWVAVSEPSRSRSTRKLLSATGEDTFAVEAGRLYRVRSCKAGSCVVSKVIWSPVFVCEGEQTEENMRSYPEGVEVITFLGSMTMAMGEPGPDNNIQYNAGLALREIWTIENYDDPSLQMKKPIVRSKNFDYQDLVLAVVYMVYERVRNRGLEDIDLSGTAIYMEGPAQ